MGIKSTTYYNLTYSGSNTGTFGGAETVTNNFTISAGVGSPITSYFNVYRPAGANASLRWNETSKWWDLIDEISRKYPSVLRELILLDPKKIERRVERDVDKAVDDYWKQTGYKKAEVYKPRYIEEKNDESVCYTDQCKALAPPMRLCAPWLDNCPKQ